MWPSAVSVNRWSSEIQATARSKCPAVVAQSRHAFVGGTKWSPWRRRTDIFFFFFLKQQKRHQKCRFVGSTQLWWFPSFVKASVLCPLPNQRERLKHTFVGSKPAEDQCQQNYLSFFSFFFLKVQPVAHQFFQCSLSVLMITWLTKALSRPLKENHQARTSSFHASHLQMIDASLGFPFHFL